MGTKHRRATITGYQHEEAFAEEVGEALVTVQKKRKAGDCPPYIQRGRQYYYSEAGKAEYFAAKVVTPPRSGIHAVPQRDHRDAALKAARLPRAGKRVPGIRLRA
jgi:hypothetical protein